MVMYRRTLQRGGVYFFTATLKNRQSTLLTQHNKQLYYAIKMTQAKYPFKMIAHVILPDHIHCLWELPENDCNYSSRWRMIKSIYVRELKKLSLPIQYNNKGEANIWARRFWEHTIRDDYDLEKHLDYIHFNPVKHGLTAIPSQWPHSSIHAYIKKNIISRDWGTTHFQEDQRFEKGE